MTNFENIKSQYFWLLNILGLLIAGNLYFFSTELTGIGFLIWIASVAVLLLAFTYSTRSGLLLSLHTYLMFDLATLWF